MKPIDQTIVNVINGNCFAACVASIFEIPLESVPNFIEKGNDWFQPFWDFLVERDYEYQGVGWPKSPDRPCGHILSESPSVDGFVIASVPSKTFDLVSHSVVMNLSGKIVHDPNPNKKWQDVNVLESKELQHWLMIFRRDESEEKIKKQIKE